MTTTTFIGAVSRDWGVAGNWSGGVPDGVNFDAVVNNGHPVIGATENVTIGSGAITTAGVDITVLGHLTVANTLTIGQGATLILEGALKGGAIAGPGTFQSFGGTLDGVTYRGG